MMISVIIPAFNAEAYLSETLISVLSQTYPDYEVIIIDDGSTDCTRAVADKFRLRYPKKIRYYYQENKGLSAARNLGIKKAMGEFLAFLDSDDCYLPNYLSVCLKNMLDYNYDFVIPRGLYHKIMLSDANYKLTYCTRDDFPNQSIDLYKKLFSFFIGCAKMLVKKSCFITGGLFDERLSAYEDWDIWIRFSIIGLRAGLTDEKEPLWIRRIRNNSLWHKSNNEKRRLLDYYLALQKHKFYAFSVDPGLKKVYGEKYWCIGTGLLRINGNRMLGAKILFISLIYDFNVMRIINSIIH